jgi:hypothetical protein
MLVRFTNVQIMSEPNGAGEILINDGSGPSQLEDTLLDTDGHLLTLVGGPLTGRVLSSLTGVVYFSGTAGGSFEIFPRTADDVVLVPLPPSPSPPSPSPPPPLPPRPPPPPRPPLSPGSRVLAAITATFTVAGDVTSFNQNAFRNALATLMGVSPSVITLSVTSASVSVIATITYPTQAAASAVATLLAATPAANFTAALGVTVQAVSNIAPTSVAVTMPSPAPPPYIPGVIVNADGTLSINPNLITGGGGSGVSTGVVVGVAVGVPSFVICVAIIMCNFKRRQKKASTIVKAIPTTTINNPVAQSSATSGVEMKVAI